jgi:hypothetical protein
VALRGFRKRSPLGEVRQRNTRRERETRGLTSKTYRTIPVDLPRLLVISPLRSSLFISFLGLVPDESGDRIGLSPIPSSNVMTLGIDLGGPDVVRGRRGLVVVQGGFGGGSVLRGD